jgi:ATP-dependent protease ClpP protease subunit
MGIFFFLKTVFFIKLMAMGSLCGSYDVHKTHPKDLGTTLILQCMHQGDALYIDGLIEPELIFELEIQAPQPIKKIYLNSVGGRVEAAFEIAEWIRDNQITTIIRPGAQCLSACTLLFQAGTERIAHPHSTLMYHSTRFIRQSQQIKDSVYECLQSPNEECETFIAQQRAQLQASTDALFDLYIFYGVTEGFYEEYQQMPLVDDWVEKGNYLRRPNWFMSPLEAQVYNITTQVSEEPFSEFQYSINQM